MCGVCFFSVLLLSFFFFIHFTTKCNSFRLFAASFTVWFIPFLSFNILKLSIKFFPISRRFYGSFFGSSSSYSAGFVVVCVCRCEQNASVCARVCVYVCICARNELVGKIWTYTCSIYVYQYTVFAFDLVYGLLE